MQSCLTCYLPCFRSCIDLCHKSKQSAAWSIPVYVKMLKPSSLMRSQQSLYRAAFNTKLIVALLILFCSHYHGDVFMHNNHVWGSGMVALIDSACLFIHLSSLVIAIYSSACPDLVNVIMYPWMPASLHKSKRMFFTLKFWANWCWPLCDPFYLWN